VGQTPATGIQTVVMVLRARPVAYPLARVLAPVFVPGETF